MLLRERGALALAITALDRATLQHGIRLSSYISAPSAAKGNCKQASGVFDAIYESNTWGSHESRSGAGSEREYTANYRRELVKLIGELNLARIFDAPCGDLNWIADVVKQTGVEYKGGDISEKVIASNRRNQPCLTSHVFDVREDKFPEVDAWHCRDCLFHLSEMDIFAALTNFCASQIKYALITTHKARALRNRDIVTGGFRFLDLERPPYLLPTPLRYLQDYQPGRDFPRYVGVWSREQILHRLRSDAR